MKRYEINTDFFKNWSQDTAYVLGYIYADGNLAKDYIIKCITINAYV